MSKRLFISLFAVMQWALAPFVFAQTVEEEENTVELSPFVVDATEDKGWVAENTLAGSRLNTSLNDLANPISVFTEQFLEDFQIQNPEELYDYMVNAVIDTGEGLNNGNQDRGQDVLNDTQAYRVRGLQASQGSDYFISIYGGDSYNTIRYDESRGPNGLLFGVSDAGGIVNTTTAPGSTTQDKTEIQFSTQNDGGSRQVLKYNKVLIEDKLGLFIAGLNQEYDGYQDNTYKDRERLFGALTFQVNDKLSFRLNAEKGNHRESTQRLGPLNSGGVMVWTDWVNAVGMDTLLAEVAAENISTSWNNVNGDLRRFGVSGRNTNLNNERITYVANDQTVHNDAGAFGSLVEYGSFGVVSPDGWTRPANYSGNNTSQIMQDETLFPRTINVNGPGNHRTDDFQGWSFFTDFRVTENLYINYAHNQQTTFKEGYTTGGQNFTMYVDVNPTLGLPENFGPTGRINPYAGQMYTQSNWGRDQNWSDATTDRVTASYEFDFRDGLNWLGTHQFSGMAQKRTRERTRVNGALALLGAPFENRHARNNNKLYMRNYFTFDDVAADTSVLTIAHWNEAPSFVTLEGQRYDVGWTYNTPGNNNISTTDKFETLSLSMQSRFWENRVVTTLGYREDTIDQIRYGWTLDDELGFFPDRSIDIDNSYQSEGDSKNVGIVYHVLPALSLTFNASSNLGLPDPDRAVMTGTLGTDFEIRQSDPTVGESKDIGIKFRLLDNRITGTLQYYETEELDQVGGSNGNDFVDFLNGVGNALDGAGVLDKEVYLADMEALGFPTSRDDDWTGRIADFHAEGVEFTLNARMTQNWNLRVGASKTDRIFTNVDHEREQLYGMVRDDNSGLGAEYQQVLVSGLPDGNGVMRIVPDVASTYTAGGFIDTMFQYASRDPNFDFETTDTNNNRTFIENIQRAQANSINLTRYNSQRRHGLNPYKANFQTSYNFPEGRLSGVTVGGGTTWKQGAVVGINEVTNEELVTRELWTNDLWLRYRFKGEGGLKSGNWTAQLNIKNIFDNDDAIFVRPRYTNIPRAPITESLPGDWGQIAGRIDYPLGRTWRFTLTYDF